MEALIPAGRWTDVRTIGSGFQRSAPLRRVWFDGKRWKLIHATLWRGSSWRWISHLVSFAWAFFFPWSARGSFHRQKLFRGVKIDFFTPYGDGDFGRVEDVRIAPKTPKSEVTHEDEASGRQKCFAGWLLWLKIQDQPDYHATRIVQQNDSSSAVMLPKKENWINGWLDNKEIIVK